MTVEIDVIPTAKGLGWTGRSYLMSSADGDVTLYNRAGSSFDQLQFGGTSSSFPSLRRNATALECRLADDSAYSPFAYTNAYGYNAFTSSTNYERGAFEWASNILKVGTQKGSGGGSARGLNLIVDDAAVLQFASDNKWFILGPTAFNTCSDTSSSENMIVAVARSGYTNAITGTAQLRGIFSGYDNIIDANIASNAVGTHHSVIEDSTGGHTTILGGACHRAVRAANTLQYSGVLFGTDCTVGGNAASCLGSRYSTAYGVDCSVVGSTLSSIGLILGTGVATTTTNASPTTGSTITLSSTASFGSVNDIVTVAMDSVSLGGSVIKVLFTCTITSSTVLTIRSNVPTLWDNKPNITNGALVYPTYATSSTGSQQAIIASTTSHIQTQGGGNICNTIIGGNTSVIANGTDNANGTLYPGYSTVFGRNCTSNGPNQFIRGINGKALNAGQEVRSYGKWTNDGDRQVVYYFSGGTTTNSGAATDIYIPYALNGTLGQNYVLKPSMGYLLEAHVLAVQTAGTGGAGANVAGYRVNAVMTSSAAGAVTIKTQTTTVLHEDVAGWNVTIVKYDAAGLGGAYTTNNQAILRFQVTGDAARTIRWWVDVKIVEQGWT